MKMGAQVTDLKKPDLKTGGSSGASGRVFIIESVENGYILRSVDVASELEQVHVYLDRSELLREIAKNL